MLQGREQIRPRRSDSSNLDSHGTETNARIHADIAAVGEGAFPARLRGYLLSMDFRSIIAGYASNGTALNGQQRNEKNLTTVDLLFFLPPLLRTAASVYSWTALKTSHVFAGFCRPGLVRVVPRFRGARVRYTFIRAERYLIAGIPCALAFSRVVRSPNDIYGSFRFAIAIAYYSGQNNRVKNNESNHVRSNHSKVKIPRRQRR